MPSLIVVSSENGFSAAQREILLQCGKRSVVAVGKGFFELAKRFNGRTRQTISDLQLRSGIVLGSVTDALHQMAPSLGILPGPRVFITAFYTKNLAQFCANVKPAIEKTRLPCYNNPKERRRKYDQRL